MTTILDCLRAAEINLVENRTSQVGFIFGKARRQKISLDGM
jgi:hypothetical protein